MSRNMIDANRRLFAHLEEYCARREEPLGTAGAVRWVHSPVEVDRETLKNAKVLENLRYGRYRALCHLELANSHYVGLVGFDFPIELPQLVAQEVTSGFAVTLLSELRPQPLAGPSAVRDVVEVGQRGETGYAGHESEAIQTLFPSLQLLECRQPPEGDAIWRLFLMICSQECQQGGSWMEAELTEALVSLTDLSVAALPYRAICLSMFDADPRSLFMALYRCIEATYAYESAQKIVDKFSLEVTWQELAEALDEEIGWHPQEASSLNLVLKHALQADLDELCRLFKVEAGTDVAATAGKVLYRLRNRVVHHRTGEAVGFDEYDWNSLCRVLIDVVFHVFTHAYARAE